MNRSFAVLIVCALACGLAACQGSATRTPPTASVKASAAYRYVPNYTKAPCWMQRKWAEHNSVHASTRGGKSVVYKADCDLRKKKAATS